MAQWRALQTLVTSEKISENQLQVIYSNRRHFSVLFRDKFATWIESQNWDEYFKGEDVQKNGKIMFDELVQQMEDDLETQTMINRLALTPALEDFKQNYEGNYEEFINLMIHLLRTENILIQSTQETSGEERHFDVAQENREIAEELKKFETQLRASNLQLRQLESKQSKLKPHINDIHAKLSKIKRKNEPGSEEELKFEKELNTISCELLQLRKDVVEMIGEVCDKMHQILTASWNDLKQWKKDQRLACTMLCKPKEGVMEVLDALFEHVATIFRQALNQVDELVRNLTLVRFENDRHLMLAEQYSNQMDEWLLKHLNKVFLVDKNVPKQVLKVTNGKSLGFSMSVRLLGGYALGLYVNKPKVSVRLYPEKQLNDVVIENMDLPSSCNIQNSENKPAVSLPIVVTSQTSQECMARGTIIWSAAFRRPKDKMPGCDFPFWKWFMACLNSVKDTVSREWKEGLIYGFISKKKAEEILKNEKCGTFLIRFSESIIESGQRADIHGYLTVAFKEIHPEDDINMWVCINSTPLQYKFMTVNHRHVHDKQFGDKKLLKTLWTPEGHFGFDDVFAKFIKEEAVMPQRRRPRQRNSLVPMSPMNMSIQSPAASDFSEVLSPPPDMPILYDELPTQNQQLQQKQEHLEHIQQDLMFPTNPSPPVAFVQPMTSDDLATLDMLSFDRMLNLVITEDDDVMLNMDEMRPNQSSAT
ncbi:hypothetical protein LSH36_246g06030 [Paralvinella palmiformis]|uniref:Signal transducer and activator of transcription n=1 Tax=Paralvinella palmiformis TaxID=53620 RepID=A0AAD9JLC1_9ANNE|nr:hypothetical protein LSH36_246g06030 [Paralvinella palmiformis]